MIYVFEYRSLILEQLSDVIERAALDKLVSGGAGGGAGGRDPKRYLYCTVLYCTVLYYSLNVCRLLQQCAIYFVTDIYMLYCIVILSLFSFSISLYIHIKIYTYMHTNVCVCVIQMLSLNRSIVSYTSFHPPYTLYPIVFIYGYPSIHPSIHPSMVIHHVTLIVVLLLTG